MAKLKCADQLSDPRDLASRDPRPPSRACPLREKLYARISVLPGTAPILIPAGVLLVSLSVVACADHFLLAPISENGAQFTMVPSCELDEELCAALDSAIVILEENDDPYCQALGEAARERFNSTAWGYLPGEEQLGIYSYVPMRYTGGGPYGWEPADGNVYVNQEQIMQVGYTIDQLARKVGAHEPNHQWGWPPDHYPPPPPIPCDDWY